MSVHRTRSSGDPSLVQRLEPGSCAAAARFPTAHRARRAAARRKPTRQKRRPPSPAGPEEPAEAAGRPDSPSCRTH